MGGEFNTTRGAFSDVYFRLLLAMDTTPTSVDCACQATDVAEGQWAATGGSAVAAWGQWLLLLLTATDVAPSWADCSCQATGVAEGMPVETHQKRKSSAL